MSARDAALAFSALGALLEAEAAPSRAFEAVSARISAGATREALEVARARIEGGVGVVEALSEALPGWAALFEGDEATLPARLKQLGAHHLRIYNLSRRMHAVALYPLLVTLGALILSGGLLLAAQARLELMDISVMGAARLAPHLMWALTGASLALFLYTLKRIKEGRAPLWFTIMPGGSTWALRAEAERVSHRALTLEAPSASEEARPAKRALLHEVAEAMALESEAPREALEALAARLTEEAEAASRRLIMSSGYLFLLLAALAVAAAFPALYLDIFSIAGSVAS